MAWVAGVGGAEVPVELRDAQGGPDASRTDMDMELRLLYLGHEAEHLKNAPLVTEVTNQFREIRRFELTFRANYLEHSKIHDERLTTI